MAISAYRGGKLKKHALSGTSLAVDPTRTRERALFTELHNRAKTAGDPAAFKSRVAGEFAQSRQRGLAAIAQGRGEIGHLSREASNIEARRAGAQDDISKYQNRSLALESAMQSYRPGGVRRQGGKGGSGLIASAYSQFPGDYSQDGLVPDADNRTGLALGDSGKHFEWKQDWLRRNDMYDDYQAFSKTLGTTDEEQRFEGRRRARDAFGSDKYSIARKYNPRMIAYLAEMKKREEAAQQYLPGSLATLADRRAQIGDLQSSVNETSANASRRGGVYSGFFGGIE